MHWQLRGYTLAVFDGPAGQKRERMASDLRAVAHLVSRTNDLATTLTDFGVPVASRRAVLKDLLSERIDPDALRVVLRAIEIERADEILTALHDLCELALHADQGLPGAGGPGPTLGAFKQFATGYSHAVFEEVPSSGELEDIEDELFRFARIVESHPSLRSALSDPSRSAKDRGYLVASLIAPKVRPTTLRLTQLCVRGRVRDVVGALDWLVEQAADARGWRVARVRTARPIDSDERERLVGLLGTLTDAQVELQVTEDPELLGGAVINIGDLLVDASAQHRLDRLRERLLETETARQGEQ